MGSIHKEILLDVPVQMAWAALRDVGAAHTLFRGILTDCEYEDGVRTVTFEGGMLVQERIIDVNDDERRVAYSVLGNLFDFHSASMQIMSAGQGRSRFVWITDFLPEERYEMLMPFMEQGSNALAKELASRYESQPGAQREEPSTTAA